MAETTTGYDLRGGGETKIVISISRCYFNFGQIYFWSGYVLIGEIGKKKRACPFIYFPIDHEKEKKEKKKKSD